MVHAWVAILSFGHSHLSLMSLGPYYSFIEINVGQNRSSVRAVFKRPTSPVLLEERRGLGAIAQAFFCHQMREIVNVFLVWIVLRQTVLMELAAVWIVVFTSKPGITGLGCWHNLSAIIEFSVNVFTEFSSKNICRYSKRF